MCVGAKMSVFKAEAGSWAHRGDGGQSEGCVAPRCISWEVCGAIWDSAKRGASLVLQGTNKGEGRFWSSRPSLHD